MTNEKHNKHDQDAALAGIILGILIFFVILPTILITSLILPWAMTPSNEPSIPWTTYGDGSYDAWTEEQKLKKDLEEALIISGMTK